jgi:hypothetical protein
MTDIASLPSSVLVKIATLEQACIDMTTKLERSRKELQRLKIELRDLTPRTVHDEEQANRESERLIAENRRLENAIAAQVKACEEQEKRLQAEERCIRDCKLFLHDLPPNVYLRVKEGYPCDLGAIREHIRETQDEIGMVQRMPVPSDDLAERVAHYVAWLAARAEPIVRGVAGGELSVHWPMRPEADRITHSGFAQNEGNPLLLMAFMDGETLAARLMMVALAGSIQEDERAQRLHELHERLTEHRYDEEAAVVAALARGEDVTRDAPPWFVLQVQIEHEQAVAA